MIELETLTKNQDVSLVIAGSAGQGLKTLEFLFTSLFKQNGYFVFSTQELMSRVRGGTNTLEVRFSKNPCFAFINRIDLLFVLNKDAITRLKKRITDNTIIVSPFDDASKAFSSIHFPIFSLAKEMGSEIYSNSIVLGIVSYLFSLKLETLESLLKQFFTAKGKALDINNISSAKRGFDEAKRLWPNSSIKFPTVEDPGALDNTVLMNGADAIASGAIAGGCNFVCAYPMSPSTGVLINLAKKSLEYHIGIEQVEDEIAAANMAIGAGYAGGRAFVTTSGGGLALMCEAVSLAGMTETPLVIMIGQRPGPATGLPTRTEQGDFNLVLHAGHGEFPRFIFAPGHLQEAFDLTKHAFEMTDKFQTPAFILSDQYGLDSRYPAEPFDEKPSKSSMHIVKTTANYKRFQLTDNGISPRGIPGYGDGIVCADSDEHTEAGYITEDFEMRQAMQNKRMKKLSFMQTEAIPPTFYGVKEYDCLIVCWGTNFYAVKESVLQLNQLDASKRYTMLHFSQLYPLNLHVKDHFRKGKMLIALENNSTHQFASLIEATFEIKFNHYILQYNGLPFAVETIIEKVKALTGGEAHV